MNNLTDEELELMLEKAASAGAEKALEKLTNQIYQEVGKTVLKRLAQMAGALAVGIVIWAGQNGWFK